MPMITIETYVPSFADTTVRADEVRKGDLGTDSSPVTAVEVKTKYTYITFEGSEKPVRFENDWIVTIRRETEESIEQRHELRNRERRNRRILDWYENYQPMARAKHEQERINAIVTGGSAVDSFRMTQFIEAQAADRMDAEAHYTIQAWFELQAGCETEGKLAKAFDLVEVADLIVEKLLRRMVIDTRHGLSRSTGVITNAMEDADREARAKFLDNSMWTGGRFL